MNNLFLKSGLVLAFLLLLPLLYFTKKDPAKAQSTEPAMFLKDQQHSANYSSSASVENEPHLLWKLKTGGPVVSSPVISEGVLYAGSNDKRLYAIDAASGRVLWEFETAGAVNSTPLVARGRVMFLSMDGYFYALDKKDGELQWKFRTQGEEKFKVKDYYNGSFKPDFWDFYLSSPVIRDELVYFGSSDAKVYALDMNTGKEVWSYKTGGSVHSSPAISGNALVVGSWDSNVYCLDVGTGEEKWKFSTGKDTTRYIWLGVQASPSIKDGMVYIGSRDAKFYALDLEKGEPEWVQDDFERSWMPSSASIGEQHIYTGSSDAFNFYSMEKETGKINYTTNTKSYTFSSPATDGKMAYIGAANGRLYGIELESGNIKWEFETSGVKNDSIRMYDARGKLDKERYKALIKDIENMPALSAFMEKAFAGAGAILSSPLISDQVIYFGSSDGSIYAVSDK